MKFPRPIRYRGKTLAIIYDKSDAHPYRVAWRVAGKRRMASFASFSLAKQHAEGLVKELAKGSSVSALHPAQARDALAALDVLADYYRATGRRVSLLTVASEYAQSGKKLDKHTLTEAVDGFLSNVAAVKRVLLSKAVEDFVESRRVRTIAKDGKRPQLSPGWHYVIGMWLKEFSDTFPNHAVCDLTKEHLTKYLNGFTGVSPRTRNGRRNAVKMLLKWCVEKEYLSANHKLLVADGMKKEVEDLGDIEFYTPKELQVMLESSLGPQFKSLLPMIALGGLAGLRLQEIARLTWEEVWRIPKHIEISATKAKTRQRRLVSIVPSLAAWLSGYVGEKGLIWNGTLEAFHDLFNEMRDEVGVPIKRNGLRHAFCTYHFALHSNENLTAAQAGNSPAMIHAHYKGLATKSEAQKWFAVRPKNAVTKKPLLTTKQ